MYCIHVFGILILYLIGTQWTDWIRKHVPPPPREVFPLTPVSRDRAEMSIVQNYQLMQACAEKLTALKKYMEDPECNPQEVETLHKEFRSLETQLHQVPR